ncbi:MULTISPECIES: helix-turn-helix domain-containing protein [Burkholderia]|uniref:XRE family transcriptional regulator n=2 Tax=Burkholderia cepacia complex TaxID=87882 RepID=A0A3R9CTY8_9BURK|nr:MULTISPECIES: helix-turn-helix transcriptional regulator [Burkholderia]ACA89944.1 transcriptional regulator, Cro/CI family [Burkholderia orbicola MC0-3]MBJ9691793.1 helix-turn-helix transcriptional regulator [Burkholderia cenocepacia]MBL3963004.1 helix-turn-helix transcriptional regulator [Burkholderia sp. KCJ3K979]MDN7533778.1 helix-turn-helix transcriptional regulator [Burkholderia orbicola]NTZ08890.1 helix-turn-helix transcriptional regulator [Burkholderia metallica]
MDVFGERLKCERVRLGLNQTEFAALGAVKQRAQYQYEKGLRRPNSDYLRAIALAGVDVWYVLTGEESARLENLDERRIVSGFRALDARKREVILALIEAIAERSSQ